MNGRFCAAIVAFASATAVVTHASTLLEFFVQLHDPNLLGGPLFAALLATLGYPFVLSLCAVLTGAAVLLVGWRTRVRGASDWYAALASVLAVLCLTGRLGVSLDPIGWACAAGLCILLDRDDDASAINAVALVALWSLLQGGASLGALLAIFSLAGTLIDTRRFDAHVRRKTIVAASACIAGAFQLHALPWHAYGAHALYLDALAMGAQRDRIWGSGSPVCALGFSLIVIVAAWYGVRRRAQSAEALAFFGLLVLSLVDARNLPYFGIVTAPIVADAVASFYIDTRTFPVGSVRQYFVSFIAASAIFVAALTSSQPKVLQWPLPFDSAVQLLSASGSGTGQRVLCIDPRWCDDVRGAVLDDRAGLASAQIRRIEFDVANVTGTWRTDLRAGGVNAIIAKKDDAVEALLDSGGWHRTAADRSRVLLQRTGAE